MTRPAEDRAHSRDVALAEHAVLREDDDLASDAAGPLMNSTLFCAASGATWSATPDDVEPPMIL